MSALIDTYRRRADVANTLLDHISRIGRQFFRRGDSVSRFEVDDRGRIWFIDKYSGHRLYCHGHYALDYRFTEGGTLRSLCLALRNYIRTGNPISSHHLGPWDEMFCDGDPWGYGKENMAFLRDLARRLEVTS